MNVQILIVGGVEINTKSNSVQFKLKLPFLIKVKPLSCFDDISGSTEIVQDEKRLETTKTIGNSPGLY